MGGEGERHIVGWGRRLVGPGEFVDGDEYAMVRLLVMSEFVVSDRARLSPRIRCSRALSWPWSASIVLLG
jgi:hypothetical protein